MRTVLLAMLWCALIDHASARTMGAMLWYQQQHWQSTELCVYERRWSVGMMVVECGCCGRVWRHTTTNSGGST